MTVSSNSYKFIERITIYDDDQGRLMMRVLMMLSTFHWWRMLCLLTFGFNLVILLLINYENLNNLLLIYKISHIL